MSNKKNIFSRVLAFILAVAPIVVLCFFAISTFLLVGIGEMKITEIYKELIKGFTGESDLPKLFGFLPLVLGNSLWGKVFSIGYYFIFLGALINVILMIVALFSGRKAPKLVRTIAFINLFIYGTYFLGLFLISKYYGAKPDLLTKGAYPLIGIVGVSLLVYLVTAFAKAKKASFYNIFMMILTLGFVASYAYTYFYVDGVRAAIETAKASKDAFLFKFIKEGVIAKYTLKIVTYLCFANLFFAGIRLSTKKGVGFDIAKAIVNLVVATFVVALSFPSPSLKALKFMDYSFYAIIAFAFALLQLLVACAVKSAQKKAVAPALIEEEEAPIVEIIKEEELDSLIAEEEAFAEETPVEEEVVEEAPAEEPAPAPAPAVQVAGYDFYNTKSFDPFIATLNDAERQEFTEIFILKCRGDVSNLPDYEVGANNSAFFRKVFVYLGQYREKLSAGLLAKMYQFLMKK